MVICRVRLPDLCYLRPPPPPPLPRPLVLCGPSGSGKSTVMKKLMAEFGEYFGFSVSHTTRQPRPGEEDGRDYHYVTRETMIQLVEQGQFIENAQFRQIISSFYFYPPPPLPFWTKRKTKKGSKNVEKKPFQVETNLWTSPDF